MPITPDPQAILAPDLTKLGKGNNAGRVGSTLQHFDVVKETKDRWIAGCPINAVVQLSTIGDEPFLTSLVNGSFPQNPDFSNAGYNSAYLNNVATEQRNVNLDVPFAIADSITTLFAPTFNVRSAVFTTGAIHPVTINLFGETWYGWIAFGTTTRTGFPVPAGYIDNTNPVTFTLTDDGCLIALLCPEETKASLFPNWATATETNYKTFQDPNVKGLARYGAGTFYGGCSKDVLGYYAPGTIKNVPEYSSAIYGDMNAEPWVYPQGTYPAAKNNAIYYIIGKKSVVDAIPTVQLPAVASNTKLPFEFGPSVPFNGYLDKLSGTDLRVSTGNDPSDPIVIRFATSTRNGTPVNVSAIFVNGSYTESAVMH